MSFIVEGLRFERPDLAEAFAARIAREWARPIEIKKEVKKFEHYMTVTPSRLDDVVR